MPKNISKVYQELNVFSIYIKGLVISIGLIISSNVNKWLKALLANTALIKVSLITVQRDTLIIALRNSLSNISLSIRKEIKI